LGNPQGAPNTESVQLAWLVDLRQTAGHALARQGRKGVGVAVLRGGLTWTAPIKVDSTPDSLTGNNGHAFTPSVHVLPDGTVGVSYYDFRFNNPISGATDTDHWLVHCHAATEGCRRAGNWNEEVRVTPTSFDSRQAPLANGFFLGDYVGLDDDGTRFTASFTQGVSPATPPTSSTQRSPPSTRTVAP
jgi:hypothetical protein